MYPTKPNKQNTPHNTYLEDHGPVLLQPRVLRAQRRQHRRLGIKQALQPPAPRVPQPLERAAQGRVPVGPAGGRQLVQGPRVRLALEHVSLYFFLVFLGGGGRECICVSVCES